MFIMLIALIPLIFTSGCIEYWKDQFVTSIPTPTPVTTITPTPTITPTSKPINDTIEKKYLFVEKFYAGIEEYNKGINAAMESQSMANASLWKNASEKVLIAKSHMEKSMAFFKEMEQYVTYKDELNLSQKWHETAEQTSKSYAFQSDAYIERAFQDSRPNPNYIKFNYYVEQANLYNSLAMASRMQAEKIQSGINMTL
jgi:hypothetical protein